MSRAARWGEIRDETIVRVGQIDQPGRDEAWINRWVEGDVHRTGKHNLVQQGVADSTHCGLNASKMFLGGRVDVDKRCVKARTCTNPVIRMRL